MNLVKKAIGTKMLVLHLTFYFKTSDSYQENQRIEIDIIIRFIIICEYKTRTRIEVVIKQ